MARICLVMTHYLAERVGGVELQTYHLARVLAGLGHDVHFIAHSDQGRAGTTVQADGFDVTFLPPLNRFGTGIRQSLEPTLRALKPDVLYQRGVSPHTTAASGLQIARALGARFVYGMAEISDVGEHVVSSRLHVGHKSWLRRGLLQAQARWQDRLFRRNLTDADLVIAQTREQFDAATAFGARQVRLLPSMHPLPTESTVKAEPPTVLFIAHVGRRKRAELFLDLAARCADLPAQFVIGGPIADAAYRAELTARLDALPHASWVGPLDWTASNEAFSRASLFVNTTEPGREGFPNTFIQAWMRRVPVLSLDFDPDGLLASGRLGRYAAGSFDRLVADTRALLGDPALRQQLGAEAEAYAAAHHSVETAPSRVAEAFRPVLDAP